MMKKINESNIHFRMPILYGTIYQPIWPINDWLVVLFREAPVLKTNNPISFSCSSNFQSKKLRGLFIETFKQINAYSRLYRFYCISAIVYIKFNFLLLCVLIQLLKFGEISQLTFALIFFHDLIFTKLMIQCVFKNHCTFSH